MAKASSSKSKKSGRNAIKTAEKRPQAVSKVNTKTVKPSRPVVKKKKAPARSRAKPVRQAKASPRKAANKIKEKPGKLGAAALLKKWEAEGVESGKLMSIPDGKARPEALQITYGGQNLGTSTQHFELYYDSSFGAAGQALCTAMAQTVETDYRILSSWFGGVQVDSFDLHAEPGNNGASHFDCGARDIHFDWMPTKSANWARMLSDSEIVEVFEANFNGDWNCSNSTGEGLSRVLAECMYPGNVVKKSGKSPAATWLDGGRANWVQYNKATDQDYPSIGCSVLFLNWLRYQLGFHWDDIVCAALNIGDLTLERLYQVLQGGGAWNYPGTGKGWKAFKRFIDGKFPPGTPSNLSSNNPFPFPINEKWHAWENLGKPAALLSQSSTPGAAARAVNRLDLLATGNDGAVWWLPWDGSNWQPWTSMGGIVYGGPAAIARFNLGFDAYATGTDYKLYHASHGSFPFISLPWYGLGGGTSLATAAAASWAPYRVDCFAGSQGNLLHRYSNDNGTNFSDWETLGSPDGLSMQAAPAAVARGPKLLDCVAWFSDGFLWQKSWNGTSWQPWTQIPLRKVIGQPGLCSWAPNRLDIMVLNSNSQMSHMFSLDGGTTWQDGANLGKPRGRTTIFSSPTAISWGPNRIDCFVIGSDYNLWHVWWG